MGKRASWLAASSKDVDPELDALFASSSGPVKAPSKSRYAAVKQQSAAGQKAKTAPPRDDDIEALSAASADADGLQPDDAADVKPAELRERHLSPLPEAAASRKPRREKKRKRLNDDDDLEVKYMASLARQTGAEASKKRRKAERNPDDDNHNKENNDGDGDDDDDDDHTDTGTLVHESIAQPASASDLEKASRTVFLGNVSSEAVSSKKAKRTLISHLSSVLDKNASPPQRLESIRFRSVAFSSSSIPRRAAYITKSLMDATTKSANAYAVFSSAAAARKVVADLNGTTVLDRHIRVDSVAHPSPLDHRRCVFVGNLGFVDDETVLNSDADGKTVERKRSKVPSDVEEGLWRTFGTIGRVETVRVVRDSKTRVGKGFAYVHFYDGNDVEAALLLNGKKFPPLLPRSLRVVRAKDPRKTALAQERAMAKAGAARSTSRAAASRDRSNSGAQAAAGRVGKLLGRAGAANQRKQFRAGPALPAGVKRPEQIVLEGKRASAKDGPPNSLKLGKRSKGRMEWPTNRSARRAVEWRKKMKS